VGVVAMYHSESAVVAGYPRIVLSSVVIQRYGSLPWVRNARPDPCGGKDCSARLSGVSGVDRPVRRDIKAGYVRNGRRARYFHCPCTVMMESSRHCG
jgi:hypothetical protein